MLNMAVDAILLHLDDISTTRHWSMLQDMQVCEQGARAYLYKAIASGAASRVQRDHTVLHWQQTSRGFGRFCADHERS
jgi:hypothetical protein